MKILRTSVYVCCALAVIFGCILLGHLQADAPTLILSEVKVRNDAAGFDEFIELYNPTDNPVSLHDYFIGYANTPMPSPEQSFDRFEIGQGLLEAKHYYLLAKNEADPRLNLAQKSPFTNLADTGGTLQITDQTGELIDELHWTATVAMATGNTMYMPGTTVAKSQTMTRVRVTDGTYVVMPARWQLDLPTPMSSSLLPLPATLQNSVAEADAVTVVSGASNEVNSTDSAPTEQANSQSPKYGTIEISELMPNPAAPLTDEADEFIELHNVSSETVDMIGYQLQTGNNFTYSYVFPHHLLYPDAYEAFKVSVTHLLLANSGGRGRLLNPHGDVVSQTDTYGSADPGKSWAAIDDVWQWTDVPTPGKPNLASAPTLVTKAASTNSKSPKVTKSTPKPKPATKSGHSTGGRVKTAAVSNKHSTSSLKKNDSTGRSSPVHLQPLVLAGVGLSTVLYGIYEYRQDIAQTVRRLRGYGSVRRTFRSQAEGRGGD